MSNGEIAAVFLLAWGLLILSIVVTITILVVGQVRHVRRTRWPVWCLGPIAIAVLVAGMWFGIAPVTVDGVVCSGDGAFASLTTTTEVMTNWPVPLTDRLACRDAARMTVGTWAVLGLASYALWTAALVRWTARLQPQVRPFDELTETEA